MAIKNNLQDKKYKKLKVLFYILFFLMMVFLYIYLTQTMATFYITIFYKMLLSTLFLINIIFILLIIYIILFDLDDYHLYSTAYIDPLTTLGNEFYFQKKGSTFLKENKKNRFVLVLDINKYKSINGKKSNEFGDKLLTSLGKLLPEVIPNNNVMCRISGGTFATVFTYQGDIEKLINNIQKKIEVISIDNFTIRLNASMGIYEINKKDDDITSALDKANMALTQIKNTYNLNYYIYDEKLEKKLLEEQLIELEMETALENEEFKIVYQPKVSTKDEKLIGAEALVRWNKNGKTILPNKFIPVFEKNKFINKLDLYVFEQVCKDISNWQGKYKYIPTISINVSKENFLDEHFIDAYVEISNKYQIDRSKIELEITESATADNNVNILKIFKNIKKHNFILSIDDFGTGYSSLSMLQDMPIDVIKIDKTFIDNADLKSNKNIINHIMYIAKQLGIKTITEGIETKEQVEFIKKIKCDSIQGYYYSKPIKKEKLEQYFNNRSFK